MYIVTIGPDIVRTSGGRQFYAGLRYIVSDETYRQMRQEELLSGFSIVKENNSLSDLGWKNWRHPEPVRQLLVWNTGRFGDQLWTTAVVRAIKKRSHRTQIDVVTDAHTSQIWAGNKDIRGIREEPVPFVLPEYDGVLFFDETVAARTDRDQPNCYHILFAEAGIEDFETTELRPTMQLTIEDERSAHYRAARHVENNEVWASTNHFILGLHSSSRARNLPAAKWISIIAQLQELVKDNPYIKIYGLSENDVGSQLQLQIEKEGFANYVGLHGQLSVRNVAALTRLARCVVSVDSMLLHIAAAFNTPCVALMSTVPPKERVSTYRFCVPVYDASLCRYAGDCYWKGDNFRKRLHEQNLFAKCYTPERTTCDIMRGVDAKEVVSAMNLAIGRRIDHDRDIDFVFPPLPL